MRSVGLFLTFVLRGQLKSFPFLVCMLPVNTHREINEAEIQPPDERYRFISNYLQSSASPFPHVFL